ncbi:MAG: HAMP domain-containing protein, partial [Eubacteriales bacterium]|nr:HAMP domain-containing protein [Eubacteriales bacterium]
MKVKPSTLKRKIFQWNLRMVLVTLCVFLVMNGCLFAALRHFYAGTSGLTGELPASLEQAKVLMDEPLSDTKDAAFADLAARLAPLDFHLCVRQNGAFLYRDADYMTGELTETLDQFTNADGQSHVYAQFGLTVVSRHDAAQNIDLYAFHGTTLEYALQRNGFATLLLLLLLDGGLCITGMVIVSNLFTRRLSKRITVPLDALSEAAARVTNGDMTQPIAYQGEAEFEQVCTAFNGMQTEILEANARRDAYERA